MENTRNITYIGNYRIRYKGEAFTVPVDEQGNLHLPNGRTLCLSEEQFLIVRQKIEEKSAFENNAKPMMIPTADESAQLYMASKTEPLTETEPVTVPNKKAFFKKGKDNSLEIQEETAKEKGKAKVVEEKKTTQEVAKEVTEKTVCKKQEVIEDLPSVATTKLSLIVTALVSVFVTMAIIVSLFLYFVNSGFITINSNIGVNGTTIYDGLDATANGSIASFDMKDDACIMDMVSL